MAKPKKDVLKSTIKQDFFIKQAIIEPGAIRNSRKWYELFWVQATALALIGLVYYSNTVFNDFALDDMIVIIQNDYVHEGVAGIPHILTSDAFESFIHHQNEDANQLTGGRYRPISIVTFAIEQQFMGTEKIIANDISYHATEAEMKMKLEKQTNEMHIRHFINALLYIASVIVLLLLLREVVFRQQPLAAFLSALLFTIHPIHTEVVANIKSRDEILSFLFICLTLLLAFRYLESKKIKQMLWAGLCYFLALLSKEYAIMLIVILPLSFYIFNKCSFTKSVKSSLVFLIPLGAYFLLRFSSLLKPAVGVEDDIMNNPYAFATAGETLASQIAVLFRYIKLLIIPFPLSSDYTYNQIPYVTFGAFSTWASIIVHSSISVLFFFQLRKRNVLAFAIAFYFVFLLLISNFFVNVGTPMAERFLYHSSLGFAIVIGYLISLGMLKLNSTAFLRFLLPTFVVVLVVACGVETIARNGDWKSNSVLFLKDVEAAPNSVIISTNAGKACYDNGERTKDSTAKKDWYNRGVVHLSRAIKINDKFVNAYLNRGMCYARLGNWEKAADDCDFVRKLFPTHPLLIYLAYPISNYFVNLGLEYGKQGNLLEAIKSFQRATVADPTNADIWYDLAWSYCQNKQYREGKNTLIHALQVKPDHIPSKQLLTQLNALPGL